MAIVITLGSDNRLVFEKPSGEKNTMKDPITAENKWELLEEFGERMDINTYIRAREMGNCPGVVEWKIDKMT
eukprot:701961-Heterocapsa_arctica.AAC.1